MPKPTKNVFFFFLGFLIPKGDPFGIIQIRESLCFSEWKRKQRAGWKLLLLQTWALLVLFCKRTWKETEHDGGLGWGEGRGWDIKPGWWWSGPSELVWGPKLKEKEDETPLHL
jgi:hypothetical protein